MSRYIFLWYQHLLHNQNLLLTSFYSQTCKKFLMVNTVVIPAAGLGTRLFTVTKESPKEMVPVFYKTKNGTVLLKPLLEIIFENLYDSGFRNFCLIVGRGKETIENHLSPHYDFIEFLKKKGESQYAKILSNLHKKIKPTATIGLKRVKDPRRYGVATLKKSSGYLKIVKVVEKPKNPPTNYALTGVNIFEPDIFDAIKNTRIGVKGEIQLTDAIQTLIKTKNNVVGSLMSKSEPCIDIGVPETYFDALKYSFRHIVKK